MRAFYGSRLSEHMTMTPEGYLICFDVPIARTGVQQYLRSELGLEDGDPDSIVDVFRDESEVFSEACIASFEGKPVTEDHPPVNVDTGNIMAYGRGHAQHIHRGQGEESDLLKADLVITDNQLIEKIQGGLREISCGYNCDYAVDPEMGRIHQRCIRGNHVAVVPSGRAGRRVAIKDAQHAPEEKKGVQNHMEKSKPTKNSLFAKLFSHAVKDMEPDQIADAVDEMAAQAAQATPDEAPAAPAAPAADEGTGTAEILAAIKALGEQIIAAIKPAAPAADEGAGAPPADEDPLSKLADEIKEALTPAEQENSETVPADEMPGTQDEEAEPAPASSLPVNPIPGADSAASAAILAAINAVKPIIATMPESQRKAANDAAAKSLRSSFGMAAKPKTNGYAGINAVMQQKARSAAKDSKAKANDSDIGKSIMASRNPHYMKK